MEDAIPVALHIGRLRAPVDLRVRLHTGKTIPMAIYGAESCPFPSRKVGKLRTAVADSLMPRHSSMRAPYM
eukprot:9304305-Alexandrium_andersonii.AAC.1